MKTPTAALFVGLAALIAGCAAIPVTEGMYAVPRGGSRQQRATDLAECKELVPWWVKLVSSLDRVTGPSASLDPHSNPTAHVDACMQARGYSHLRPRGS